MTPSHFNNQHDHWTHVVDYETLWVLAFAAVVVGSVGLRRDLPAQP